jgi:nicotinamide-nucleotide adenylyltransferase
MRALMIGRFQPFHKGHLLAIQEILEEAEKVTIVIGSSQYSHTFENPFTAGERHLMISSSLEREGILNFYLIPITDINVYSLWVQHIVNHVPPFDCVFTMNPLTARLFKERGCEVRTTPLYEREKYSASNIRTLILKNGPWEELVPTAVSKAMAEIDGVARMKEVAKAKESRKQSRDPIV